MTIADLFCGAGGTSEGAVEAARACGHEPKLTAINHWSVAVATHTANHPDARHFCASLDSLNPRELYKEGELDLLWASPECTHHSQARGGKPINDQSRATAWCVTRWAEALRPTTILVENVPEFQTWGPIGSNGRPLASRKGEVFRAWVATLEALGYQVGWRVLRAADYGDPTTRERLFVQAVRGRRRIVWPEPTHCPAGETDLFGTRKPWVAAREIIDWNLPGQSIFERKRPLSPKTMERIEAGLRKFGLKPFMTPGQSEREGQIPRTHSVDDPAPTVTAQGHFHLAEPFIVPQRSSQAPRSVYAPAPTVTTTSRGVGLVQPFIIAMEQGGHVRSVDKPLNTVTTAKGGAHALAQPFLIHAAHAGERRPRGIDEPMPTVAGSRGDVALCEPHLLPQNQGGSLRPVSEPAPTVACSGAIGLVEPFLVSFYGNGQALSVSHPLDTVTTKDRFGLCRPVVEINGERYQVDVRFRMLQPHELAGAQGFLPGYKFTGTKTEQVKQIGNAVPRRLARALVAAAIRQDPDVRFLETIDAAKAA